jgi:hypothetical protein
MLVSLIRLDELFISAQSMKRTWNADVVFVKVSQLFRDAPLGALVQFSLPRLPGLHNCKVVFRS